MMCTVLAPNAPWPYTEPKGYVRVRPANGMKPALSEAQVNELRKARHEKVSYAALSAKYKLGRKVLGEAVHGRGAYAP